MGCQSARDEVSAPVRGPAATAFVPSNHAKMTRKDRGLFSETVALYPDEMVQRADELGDMLAKRSKARAHYSAGARQRSRLGRLRPLLDILRQCI